jgi:hypothetical protein
VTRLLVVVTNGEQISCFWAQVSETVEHQPFDIARRNALAVGMLGAAASDKRRRDIVSIPLALVDGMRGRQASAIVPLATAEE